MATTVVLAILAVVAYLALSLDERARFQRSAAVVAWRVVRWGRQEGMALWNAIREKPVAFATPALIAVSVGVFVCMLCGRDSLSDAATLSAWGASVGPRTTNGEWWRLATSPFVHRGFVILAINAIALAEIGVRVERRVGSFVLLTAYASAAVLANVLDLWMHPLAVTSGASGGVCGVYGLLFALIMAGRRSGSDRVMSVVDVRRFAPMTALVLAVNVADAGVGTVAEIAGLVTGFAFGLLAAGPVRAGGARRMGLALATTAAIAVAAAVTLGRIIDIGPEIQRLIELEQRTATMYETSVGTFKKNQTGIDALTQMIERTIVPALQEADDRVKSLRGVPRDERPRISEAREYLRLRVESWSMRARGLRETSAPVRATTSAEADARYRSSLLILGRADAAERTALQLLDRIKI